MGLSALTIEGSSSQASDVLRRIDAGLERLASPSAIVVFAMGRLGKQLEELARGIKSRHPGVCAVLAETEGLFTERGEVEGDDGFGCLLHSGRPARVTTYDSAFGPFEHAVAAPEPSYVAGAPVVEGAQVLSPTGPCFHLFSEFPSDMGENGRVSFNSSGLGWFGAVTTSEGPIWTVNADGQVEPSTAVRLEFPALGTPLTVDAACCRIVSQSFTVTNVSGTTLLELDQVPALVALGQVTAKLPERSWIVLALTAEANTTTELSVDNAPANVRSVLASSNVPIFRPLRGIDPSRGALILKEPVARGTRVAFAIRDERMAKRNLEEALRKTRLQLSGSSPRFGLYFEGIGRGRALFGAGNVESSILRQVLGDFPILGSRSNLELEERDGSVVIQSMSGQLALFVSLS